MLKTESAERLQINWNQFISFVNQVQAIKGGRPIKPLSKLKLNIKLKESISESRAVS